MMAYRVTRDGGAVGGLSLVVEALAEGAAESPSDSLSFTLMTGKRVVRLVNDSGQRWQAPHWGGLQDQFEQEFALDLRFRRPQKLLGHKFVVRVKSKGTTQVRDSEVFLLFWVDRGEQFCSLATEDGDAPHEP